MSDRLRQLLSGYDAGAPLERASTIPADWYFDEELATLERRAVFGSNWQVIGRTDQLRNSGDFITAEVAGEPIVLAVPASPVLATTVMPAAVAAALASEMGSFALSG